MKIVLISKPVLCFFAAFFFANFLYSQQNHFIYIQSDDKQPFTVYVNAAQYNSSDAGYVIVPKLSSSQYNLKISFPGNKYPEQNFVYQLNNTDAGFALKNYGDKGWGLFNFQTLELLMTGNTALPEAKVADTGRNVFGEMLSDVVDDSTLTMNMAQEKQVEKKPAVQEQATQTNAEAKLSANASKQTVVPDVLVPAVVAVPVVSNKDNQDSEKIENKPAVVKIADLETGENREIIFTALNDGSLDTIKIIIPSNAASKVEQKNKTANNEAKDSVLTGQAVGVVEQSGTTTSAEVNSDGGVKNPFYVPAGEVVAATAGAKVVENNASKQTSKTVAEESQPVKQEKVTEKDAMVRDCKKMFSDNDFDKLKHKMFVETNDDKMVEIAKKYFQGKCVTTSQVKNLAILFPSDEGRLKFFNAAFVFVSDPMAYPGLRNQLIDPEYKRQFDQNLAK